MKEEQKLILFAAEKGFKSNVFGDAEILSDLNFYLWMCELQKWLRDKHGLTVSAPRYVMHDGEFKPEICNDRGALLKFNLSIWYSRYEDAIEAGLPEALNLINL